jgi:formamidopyrimidine-DNA glycosylase
MPELPEVETVTRGLRPKLIGRKITSIELHRANLRFNFPKKLPELTKGRKVKDITRVSKYILIILDNDAQLLLHLGMSGRLSFYDKKSFKRDKHDHVVFSFNKGLMLAFNDARRFGVLDYIAPQSSHLLLKTVGMDPFDKTLTPQWLFEHCSRRTCDMKAFLMNQKIIAGLGNIYVSEALFRAGIWPERTAKKVTLAECKKLVPAIRAVLNEAIKAGGSSLRDYVQVDGELGYFQSKFKVYGREGKPCPVCRKQILRLTQAGRSSFACKHCQK